MDLEDASIRLVQPRQEGQLVADPDPLERVRVGRLQENRRIGCSLVSLPRRIHPSRERRADDSDDVKAGSVGHGYCITRI